MKKILRSVINCGGKIGVDDLQRNLFHLAESKLIFVADEDQSIWDWVIEYTRTYTEPPTMNSVRDYFERENKLEVMDRLEEVEAVNKTYTHSDFENLVRTALREQNERQTSFLLKDAGHILTSGMPVGTGREKKDYKGYKDAIRYIMERADKLLMTDTGQVFRSDITKDSEDVMKSFENTLSNAHNAWGRGTGLDPIDTTCRGIKPGELWIHAAFTGELKSTFALNWAYKTAMIFKYNVYYYSLEMPVEQIRLILYVMHSNHPKFRRQGYEPLDYRVIRDGVSSDNQKITQKDIDFFKLVVQDFEQGAGTEYGSIIVECPDEAATTMSMVKSRIELAHQTTPIHLVFIDYLGLLAADRQRGNHRDELNSIFRDAKQMCLTFNRGERIPIVALHQINREGKKEAEKNDGRYTLQALADTSAAERTADVITYTYLDDDLRREGQTKLGSLKNRDNPHFEMFLANIHFPSRFISNKKKPTGAVGFSKLI